MSDRDAATKISRPAAKLAIAAVISYQLMLFGLIFVRPEMDPSWRALSEYALGPRGWMMSNAFLVGALSYGALWSTLRFEAKGLWGKIGLGILLLCAIATAATGIFTTDPFDTTVLSTTGRIHMISAFAALMSLPFAALLINLNLALQNPTWSPIRRPLLWTAGLPLAGLVAFGTHLATHVLPLGEHAHGPGVPLGWPPRFLFLAYMMWLITVARQALMVRQQSLTATTNP